jgi:CRISPR type I-D-associated protein Csc2
MSDLGAIDSYFVAQPHPLIGAKTIQLILIREILDYTVLRTEETRELNTVTTPLSYRDNTSIRRVAFLGSKQKAAESRELEALLRTATQEAGMNAESCYLKDDLCMRCPRCGLFGATNTKSGSERANIKHRIEYSTAFSLMPFEDIATTITFNAVNEQDSTTGQALGTRFAVMPATIFPSIVTLKSVTEREFVLAVKTILSCKGYGAETRIGGGVRNSIWGIAAGWEEVITSLELALELYEMRDALSADVLAAMIREKYIPMAGNPGRSLVLSPTDVENTVRACAEMPLDGGLLRQAYGDIAKYRSIQLSGV